MFWWWLASWQCTDTYKIIQNKYISKNTPEVWAPAIYKWSYGPHKWPWKMGNWSYFTLLLTKWLRAHLAPGNLFTPRVPELKTPPRAKAPILLEIEHANPSDSKMKPLKMYFSTANGDFLLPCQFTRVYSTVTVTVVVNLKYKLATWIKLAANLW